MKIKDPYIIVFQSDDQVQTRLCPGSWGVQEYGILIADLVRHVANAFHVHEKEVWEGSIRSAIDRRAQLRKSSQTEASAVR